MEESQQVDRSSHRPRVASTKRGVTQERRRPREASPKIGIAKQGYRQVKALPSSDIARRLRALTVQNSSKEKRKVASRP